MCTAFVPLLLYWNYGLTLVLLALAAAGYSITQLLSLRGIDVPVISLVTDIAARKRDNGRFVLGPLTLVLGIISAAILWPLQPATIGILALAFGDGLASLGGKLFGRLHIPFTGGKTCAGSLTCFVAIFISCFAICRCTKVALIVAVCGMVIEMLPLKDFDNLLIPVLLGGVAHMFIL